MARGVDLVQVRANFEVGRRIVEQEERGKDRAAYGKEVIRALAERLTGEFGRGFSTTNLACMRSFYLVYQSRSSIFQTATGKLDRGKQLEPQIGKSAATRSCRLALNWTHDVFRFGIQSAGERCFYEIEAAKQKWASKQTAGMGRGGRAQAGLAPARQPWRARRTRAERPAPAAVAT